MTKEASKTELAFANKVNSTLNKFFKQCYPQRAEERTIYGIPGEKGNGKRKGKDWTDAPCLAPNENDTCKAFFNREYSVEKMSLQVPMIMVRFGKGEIGQDKKGRDIFKLPKGSGSAKELDRVLAKWQGSACEREFLALTWVPCPGKGASKKSMPSGSASLNGSAARVPFAALETQPAFVALLDAARESANESSEDVKVARTSVPEGASEQELTFTVTMTLEQIQDMVAKVVEAEQFNAILEQTAKQVGQAIADSADKGTGIVTELSVAA